jgi:hypothetical protein
MAMPALQVPLDPQSPLELVKGYLLPANQNLALCYPLVIGIIINMQPGMLGAAPRLHPLVATLHQLETVITKSRETGAAYVRPSQYRGIAPTGSIAVPLPVVAIDWIYLFHAFYQLGKEDSLWLTISPSALETAIAS